MDKVLAIWNWALENKENVGAVIVACGGLVTALVAFAEAAVRLTPTKEDDGFVERVGAKLSAILDRLKVPNRLKK